MAAIEVTIKFQVPAVDVAEIASTADECDPNCVPRRLIDAATSVVHTTFNRGA